MKWLPYGGFSIPGTNAEELVIGGISAATQSARWRLIRFLLIEVINRGKGPFHVTSVAHNMLLHCSETLKARGRAYTGMDVICGMYSAHIAVGF